jgi:hypothetical protein
MICPAAAVATATAVAADIRCGFRRPGQYGYLIVAMNIIVCTERQEVGYQTMLK